MAMVGSVITKDMPDENHIYAGVPAKDVTDRFGLQFGKVTLIEKRERLAGYLQEFLSLSKPLHNRIRIVDKLDFSQRQFSQFSVSERLYIKNHYPEEIRFIRFLSPTKAKFIPIPEDDWIGQYLHYKPDIFHAEIEKMG
jgi:hypothetical protein